MRDVLCPECLQTMHKVQLKRHYQDNNEVIIDQCRNCGGIWFDNMELFEIRHGEAEKAEFLDLKALKRPDDFLNQDLKCPVDQLSLKPLDDPFFPTGIKVEICPQGHGFWLNRGEFVDFQSKRQDKMSKPMVISDPELDKMIRDYIDLHSEKNKYDLIGSIGRVLSSNPYDQAPTLPKIKGSAQYPYFESDPGQNQEKVVRMIANGVLQILNMILTSFYK